MNFNNQQVEIVHGLIDDRIYYLRENIGYCKAYIPDCRTTHERESNEKAIADSTVELHSLIAFKSFILKNQEVSK